MRQSSRGYADAVVEDVRQSEGAQGLSTLANEVAGVRDVVAGSDDLQDVLGDPGIAVASRRGVINDLFASRVGDPTMRLLRQTVETERPSDEVETISELADRTAAAARNLEPAGETTLSLKAAEERLDGYASYVLEGLDRERGLGEVEDELFRFLRVIGGSEDLRVALSSRGIPRESRKQLVSDLLRSKTTPQTTRLAVYATHIGRPRDYEKLLEFLLAKVADESNRRLADVRSAVELDEPQTRELAAALSRAVGHDVEVRVTVDPSVVGGFVATVGDQVVDASAKRQLELLRERLVMPEARVAARNSNPNTGESR